MPIQPFVGLFESFGDNNTTTITQLRMKPMTLLAFSCMTRPSGIALKGVKMSSLDLPISSIVLSLDKVEFLPDKSSKVQTNCQ